MMPPDPNLLGVQVAEAIGHGPSQSRRLAQRERLVRSVSERARPRRAWIAVVAATAVAVAAILVAVAAVRDPAPDEAVAPDEVADGRWLQAPDDGAVQIDLAEGTWVRVVEGARARVATTSSDRGRISLESGRVEVEVDPAAARSWTIEAGPYEVEVVGTLFAVQWDPSAGVEVEVVRGKVVVRGESLGAESISVEAGHRLRADHRQRTAMLGPLRSEPVEAPVAPEEADVAEIIEPPPEETASPRRARPSEPTWQSQANAQNYAVALERARAKGIDGLLAELPAADLLLLAETARLGKDRALARRTYERVRARFGSSSQASRAAFQLGRLAADGAGKHAEAARWFETYLRESPKGAFASEARGRLVQSLDRAGEKAKARAAAKTYLELHPAGAHAKLARSLTGAEP